MNTKIQERIQQEGLVSSKEVLQAKEANQVGNAVKAEEKIQSHQSRVIRIDQYIPSKGGQNESFGHYRPVMDENGNKIEYDDTYWMNGVDVTIPPMTQEETDFLKEWIIGVKQPHKMDETLINIISEEAEPFYSGQKNARDVAGIIQSRVKLYVNENR